MGDDAARVELRLDAAPDGIVGPVRAKVGHLHKEAMEEALADVVRALRPDAIVAPDGDVQRVELGDEGLAGLHGLAQRLAVGKVGLLKGPLIAPPIVWC